MGAGLILEAVNDVWRSEFGMDPPLGQPIEETFLDPVWRSTKQAIRDVMRDRQERWLDVGGMPLRFIPDHSRQSGSLAVLVVGHPLPSPCGTGRSLPDPHRLEAAAPH